MQHEDYMAEALMLAREAAEAGEVPVGCVIVRGGEIIARGRNTREGEHSALGHAEINAIREACRVKNDWRLDDCAIYVTLEPCPMCAGAIINARIPRVYYGARDDSMGAVAGVMNLFEEDFGNHPAVTPNILGEECTELLRQFFSRLRQPEKPENTGKMKIDA